jgi:hypothetical protein
MEASKVRRRVLADHERLRRDVEQIALRSEAKELVARLRAHRSSSTRAGAARRHCRDRRGDGLTRLYITACRRHPLYDDAYAHHHANPVVAGLIRRTT